MAKALIASIATTGQSLPLLGVAQGLLADGHVVSWVSPHAPVSLGEQQPDIETFVVGERRLADIVYPQDLQTASRNFAMQRRVLRTLMVDDVAVRLWDRVLGVHDVRTGTLTFAPGTMRMIVGASSGGSSYAVTATNELEWVLTAQRQGWAATTLMIGYDDADGDHWTLALEPTQWH